MIVSLTSRIRVHLRRPLWIERAEEPQLELQLPADAPEIAVPAPPDGYRLRVLAPADRSALLVLFDRAGFAFGTADVDAALAYCLPRGCFVVEHLSTNVLCATMMARHVSSPSHPFGGRIDWLATDPDHRQRGLGAICARSATNRLRAAGYDDIWVTTDDHRLAALKVFLGMGFTPVLHAQVGARWQQVLATVGPRRRHSRG